MGKWNNFIENIFLENCSFSRKDKIYIQYLKCYSLSSLFKILLCGCLFKNYIFISWEKNHMAEFFYFFFFFNRNNKVWYLNLALVENIIAKINKAHKFISFWDMDHIVYSPFQTAGNMVNSNYKFERTSRRRFYLVVSSFIQLRGHRF